MNWKVRIVALWFAFFSAACASAPPEVGGVLGKETPVASQAEIDLAAREARRLVDENPDSVERAITASQALFLAADLRVQEGTLAALEAQPPASLGELLDAEDHLSKELRQEVESLTTAGLEFARRALELKPQEPTAQLYVALNVSLLTWSIGKTRAVLGGRVGETENAMAAALEGAPELAGAAPYRLRGRFLGRAPWPFGNKEAALELLQHARELAPVPLNHLFLGDILHETGDLEGAQREWRAVENAVPDESTAPLVEVHRALARLRCGFAARK